MVWYLKYWIAFCGLFEFLSGNADTNKPNDLLFHSLNLNTPEGNLLLDFSKNIVDDELMQLLVSLVGQINLY